MIPCARRASLLCGPRGRSVRGGFGRGERGGGAYNSVSALISLIMMEVVLVVLGCLKGKESMVISYLMMMMMY